MTHFVFRLKNDPFFRSHRNWKNFDLALIESYAKKSEKNNGAKIFVLSITVFCWWAIKNCDFYSQLIEEYKKKLKISIASRAKMVKDRAIIFAPLFFSDFLA